jgi:hypothetical protein
MIHKLPGWAIRKAGPEDRSDVQEAFAKGTVAVEWPDTSYLRSWAKQRGWPAPIIGFRGRFTRKFLSSDEDYYHAISGSGIEIRIPVRQHQISTRELKELDDLYESRGEHGYPDCWEILVENLREIRRACEANVHVTVDGKELNAKNFYSWAHGRYHALEDGCDKWIGNDD